MQQAEHTNRASSPFRLKPSRLAVLAALSLLGSSAVFAADTPKVDDLQAEIIRLKAALEQAQQALNGQSGNRNGASVTQTAQAPETAEKKSTFSAVLDAIVVHRQTQLDTLKETPQSVSVVTGDELERLGATNITEVLRRVGNVNFNYGNPRTGTLTLRGITTGSSDQIDPTVGTVLDGVSLGYTPLVNGYVFTDIETVDVTRGPQGTEGGKASNIGRITFRTKGPTFTPEAQFSYTTGQWNTSKVTAIAGGPVIDGLLAWRGTFQRESQESPFTNQFPDLAGRSFYQNTDRTFGRVQFLLTPSPDINVKLSIEDQPKGAEFVNGLTVKHPQPTFFSDGTPRPASAVDTTYKKYLRPWFNQDPTVWSTARDYYQYPVNMDNNGSINTSSKGVTLNADWQVAGHKLESISGWRHHWFSAANDEGTPFDITKSGGYITEYDQKSQEFRISSDKGGKFDYLAGLYYFTSHNDSLTRTRYGNDAGAFNASDAQYNQLTGLTAGYGASQGLLKDSLNFAYTGTRTYVDNESLAAYGKVNWHLSEADTLAAGYRGSQDTRTTKQEGVLLDPGVGADFTTAFGTATNYTGASTPASTAVADALAARYFGTGKTWATLTTQQKNQLANAANIRNNTLKISSLYALKSAPTWEGNLKTWDSSLTHKFNEDLSVYGTLQYGEKAGMSQIAASDGKTSLVKPEKTKGLELGIRTSLLNRTLTVNADVFQNDIQDFQTTVNVADPVLTATYLAANPGVSVADGTQYVSQVGNLPGIRVRGVEVDAAYTGIKHLTLRLAAAYNDARYSEDTWLAKPNEINSTPVPFQKNFNAKGSVLNSAPAFTYNLSADYSVPVLGNYVFHTSGNWKWTSKYHTSPSSYDEVNAYGLLDLGIGIGRRDGLFDVNLVGKNVLDQKYHVTGWDGYTPSLPRWLGVVFSAKL